MIAMLAPHGFAPSEVRSWTLYEYHAVIDALNAAHGPPPKPEAPDIEEFRKFKAEYGRRH